MIKLTEEDRIDLVKLYKEAQTTPVIGFSVQQMLDGRDLASLAWNRVRNKMNELGEKYGYDPKTSAINQKTGEIQPYEQSAKLRIVKHLEETDGGRIFGDIET